MPISTGGSGVTVNIVIELDHASAPVALVLQTRVEKPFNQLLHRPVDLTITYQQQYVKLELFFITFRELYISGYFTGTRHLLILGQAPSQFTG